MHPHSSFRVKDRPADLAEKAAANTVPCKDSSKQQEPSYELRINSPTTYTNPSNTDEGICNNEVKHDLTLEMPAAAAAAAAASTEQAEDSPEKGMTSSSSSSNLPQSPVDPTSAAPLVQNGTDSRKNPFTFKKTFKLDDPPVGSPKSRGSVLSTDSHAYQNVDGGSHTAL